MNRRSLGALAIVIILLMVVVATAGLDNLPRDVRNAIATATTRLETDRAQLDTNREFVVRALRDEPVLFRTKAANYQQRLQSDATCVSAAASQIAVLQQLVKDNRRSDADRARAELRKLDPEQGCVQDAAAIRSETERWLNYKRQLPARLQAMNVSYQAVQSFNVDAAAPAVSKAMVDWPAKRDDLQGRLNRLNALKAQGENVWQNTAELRASAGSNPANFDYATFFDGADRLDQISRELKDGAAGLNDLAGQLYVAWDKLLLDVDNGHTPPAKVRVVRTKFDSAALSNGQSSSEERWENLASRVKNTDDSMGMVIERKPAGKYDSEAERVTEPPAYARIAPPGQSNQYGSWQNGVWHWLPQYLILSQLLNMNRGPIGYNDYNAYDQARRRGEVFYGRNNEFRWRHSPRTTGGGGILDRARDWARSRDGVSSPGSGGSYRERPKTYGGGGFLGSKYQSRGSYSGSRYQGRGGFSSGGFGSRSYSRGFGGGRSFGRGGRR